MPCVNSINFYHNRPKIKLFWKKKANFRALWRLPPDLRNSLPHCRFRATLLMSCVALATFSKIKISQQMMLQKEWLKQKSGIPMKSSCSCLPTVAFSEVILNATTTKFHRNSRFQPSFSYCFNRLLCSSICGILIFENVTKVTHDDSTIGR